jgi:hypothetical protein
MNEIELEARYCAHNYEPLPMFLRAAKGQPYGMPRGGNTST